jgi:hypothetical protein
MEQADQNDAPTARKKRVPNRGSFKPGQPSPNPGGRPRSGLALATAIRERIDPHSVLDLVVRYLSDESVPLQDRLHTLLPWLHAGYLKPPQTSALHITSETLDTGKYSHLSEAEVDAELQRLDQLALPTSDDTENT